MTRPLSPKFEQHLRWMETESRFAHACPDLDQEYPDANHPVSGIVGMLSLVPDEIRAKLHEWLEKSDASSMATCGAQYSPERFHLMFHVLFEKEPAMKTKRKGKGKGC